MNARVPQDVDLEDQLIYGLSPLRFAYLVVASLAALAIWRGLALPVVLRAVPSLLILAAGAGLAWGRWRGRPLDLWLLDLTVFARRNYQVGVRRRPAWRRGRAQRSKGDGAAVIIRLSAINALPGRGADPDPDASDLPPAA
jgi:hypothetical protein